ncbi:MAG TPA: TetR/AcrR family transcriptional regulator, partial [Acidimicrobiales bacterium]|nr:TetR/AcrR family transcriptional regulator [Acidimicrobiales bacterium]
MPIDTRARILDEALQSFAATPGYEATSLDVVATRLGVTKQTILHHFGSKAALLDAVIDRSAEDLSDALERALAKAGPGFERV